MLLKIFPFLQRERLETEIPPGLAPPFGQPANRFFAIGTVACTNMGQPDANYVADIFIVARFRPLMTQPWGTQGSRTPVLDQTATPPA